MRRKTDRPTNEPMAIYSDGGVIRINPSPEGGTWAWVWVDENGESLREESGFIPTGSTYGDRISNNVAELEAAVRALESVPRGWDGTLYTDSQITLLRVTTSLSFAGVPEELVQRCLNVRTPRRYEVVLLSGHPTREQLRVGIGKGGRPVSIWNCRCDALCGLEARKYLNGDAPVYPPIR